MGKPLSKTAVLAKGALMSVIAADAQINLDQILAGVTSKNWLNKKPAIAAGIKSKLAKDTDIKDVVELLDRLDDAIPEDDDLGVDDHDKDPLLEEILDKLRGKLTDEDLEEVRIKLYAKKDTALDVEAETANDLPKNAIEAEDMEEKEEEIEAKEEVRKAAMDRAIKIACDATAERVKKETAALLRQIEEAKEAVFPYVGKLNVAMDSADDVYKSALKVMGVDVEGVHPSAYKHILKAHPNPSSPSRHAQAHDHALSVDVLDLFPRVK